jgi:hypothetical protein
MPVEAMAVMRHKSLKMTMHYTHTRHAADSVLRKLSTELSHERKTKKNQKKLKKSPEFLKNAVMSHVKI